MLDHGWKGEKGVEVGKLRPAQGFASFWSTPAWIAVSQKYDLRLIDFDQGPLLHPKLQPTSIGSNMIPAAELIDCRGPGTESWDTKKVPSIEASKAWSAWAPGLIAALGFMIDTWIVEGGRKASFSLKKVDPAFVEHIRQHHSPYRRDCRHCVQGGAKQRPRRRVLTPQSWSRSVDTAGPFIKAQDEFFKAARYLVVGVLTVPKLCPKADKPIEVPDPGEEADRLEEELAMDDLFGDPDAEPEREEARPAKDEESARSAWKVWQDLVEKDQAAWKEEAEAQHLPYAEMIDWIFVEQAKMPRTL